MAKCPSVVSSLGKRVNQRRVIADLIPLLTYWASPSHRFAMAAAPSWAERTLSDAFGMGSRGQASTLWDTLVARGDEYLMDHAAALAR